MKPPLILGHRPGGILNRTHDIGVSSTSRRLDKLYPRWRYDFESINLHWQSDDFDDPEPDHLSVIIEAYDPDVIVALGAQVYRELGGDPKADWLTAEYVRLYPRWRHIVKFPHPSGRNRWWNDGHNCDIASQVLEEIARDPFTAFTHILPTRPTVRSMLPTTPAPRGGIRWTRSSVFVEDKDEDGEWRRVLVPGVASVEVNGVELSDPTFEWVPPLEQDGWDKADTIAWIDERLNDTAG